MILSGKAKVAGLMGWPVSHSRSPRLHGYWLGQPIERVLPGFGELIAVRGHPVLQELQFTNWRVAVHEGRVVMATPGVLSVAS